MREYKIYGITLGIAWILICVASLIYIDKNRQKDEDRQEIKHLTPKKDTVVATVDRKTLFVFFDVNSRKFETDIVDEVERFYGVPVYITHQELPLSTYNRGYERHIAPLINDYLLSVKPLTYDKVVGITQSDISDRMLSDEDFGIFGEAITIPGDVCIVSNFRVKNNNKGLLVTILHELGHCYGLYHCNSDKNCLMTEGGKVPLLNGKPWLCGCCREKLKL